MVHFRVHYLCLCTPMEHLSLILANSDKMSHKHTNWASSRCKLIKFLLTTWTIVLFFGGWWHFHSPPPSPIKSWLMDERVLTCFIRYTHPEDNPRQIANLALGRGGLMDCSHCTMEGERLVLIFFVASQIRNPLPEFCTIPRITLQGIDIIRKPVFLKSGPISDRFIHWCCWQPPRLNKYLILGYKMTTACQTEVLIHDTPKTSIFENGCRQEAEAYSN